MTALSSCGRRRMISLMNHRPGKDEFRFLGIKCVADRFTVRSRFRVVSRASAQIQLALTGTPHVAVNFVFLQRCPRMSKILFDVSCNPSTARRHPTLCVSKMTDTSRSSRCFVGQEGPFSSAPSICHSNLVCVRARVYANLLCKCANVRDRQLRHILRT